MSTIIRKQTLQRFRRQAPLFAALGDEVRLTLLTRLSESRELSITELSAGSAITRQAITKHLRVLETTGLVRSVRRGRESLFQLQPKPLQEATDSLRLISQQWDAALQRLKKFVEE